MHRVHTSGVTHDAATQASHSEAPDRNLLKPFGREYLGHFQKYGLSVGFNQPEGYIIFIKNYRAMYNYIRLGAYNMTESDVVVL